MPQAIVERKISVVAVECGQRQQTVMQAHELQVLVCAGDPVGNAGRAGVAAGQCLESVMVQKTCARRSVDNCATRMSKRRRHRHASSPRRRDLPLAELLGIVERARLGRSVKRIAPRSSQRSTPWPS